MKKKVKMTRRNFISSAAAGLAITYIPRHVLGGPGYIAPSEKLRVAAIGFGGMGQSYLNGC